MRDAQAPRVCDLGSGLYQIRYVFPGTSLYLWPISTPNAYVAATRLSRCFSMVMVNNSYVNTES